MKPPDSCPLIPSGFVTITSKRRLRFGPLVYVVTLAWISVEFTTVRVFTDGERPGPLKLNDAPAAKFVPVIVNVPAVPACKEFGTTEVTTGGGVTPVPLRLTVCGLSLASSVMLTTPVRVPVAVGVKVTLIWQLALAASGPTQPVAAKSPLAPTLLMLSGAVPVFVSVTVCEELVVPTT